MDNNKRMESMTKGLEYINKEIPEVAEEMYEDKRVQSVLNVEHVPQPADMNLMEDMISRIRKIGY